MPTYIVRVKDVYEQNILVEADNEIEATEQVFNTEGVELDKPYYSYSLAPEEWEVKEDS